MSEDELHQRLDAVQQQLDRMTAEFEQRRARVFKTVEMVEETLRRIRRRADEYDRAA